MVEKSNQNVFLIQMDASSFAEFEISEFEISIDMTLQKWAIFIMGVYGEISHFLSDPSENVFLVI